MVSQGPSGYSAYSLAGGGAAPARLLEAAILVPVCGVRMRGTGNPMVLRVILRIVPRPGVLVWDQHGNRGPYGSSILTGDTGYHLEYIRLIPLCREAGLTGPAAVKLSLDDILGKRETRGKPVNYHADKRPMGLSKCCDAEIMTKGRTAAH